MVFLLLLFFSHSELNSISRSLDYQYIRLEEELESTDVVPDKPTTYDHLTDVTRAIQTSCFAECMPEDNNCMLQLERHPDASFKGRIIVAGYPPYREYIIVAVRRDLTIKSEMQGGRTKRDSAYSSYAAYLKNVQGLEVKRSDAPMLEVPLLS
jgi:hypothetical protein